MIRAAFGERRKTLANALASGLGLSREEVSRAMTELGMNPRIRGERLHLEEFKELADLLIMRRDLTTEGPGIPNPQEPGTAASGSEDDKG